MASNPCAKCSKSVFFVEQTIGPKGLFYHKTCLTCATCNKRLETSNLTEHKDQTYCKSCYAKNFGPSGYGFGGGGAGLSVANGASQEAPSISPTAQTNSTPSKWGGATDQCMVCQKNVYFAEKGLFN